MCSHISSDSGGGGGGGDQYLKKQKKQRMRRRGPGVAELEKILREQENANTIKDKEIIIRSKFEGVSSCMLKPLPHSSSYRPRSSAITLSNSSLPFDLNCTALISPPPPSPLPKTSLYGNGSSNKCTLLGGGSANGDHNGLHIGGPGQALLPTAWGTCESSNNGKYPKFSSGVSIHVQSLNGSNQKIPSTPPLPKKHCQYSYTTVRDKITVFI
ncbi:hypothetical protein CFOL_v3_22240 [Cephalotus follicularis]|uniref:Uncharacterized protein n=1 Tax=Cephalotus follicularis TaxID=3775 RepID=A0A1Q3CEZ1_CEPFO|nr:hypothetical protein CFOL_v3_22240 [Cephalotus follicularis]